MSPFDYLTRAEPFDPRGTPYAGDAQAQPLNALARIFGQEETAVDPTRRYGSANALKGTPDAYWSEAMMTPGQRTARNILASEPVQTVMNWANFAGPAMRAMPRPVMAPEGPQGIRAYHGSPHDFDKFDLSKIGTGEGAQAYGLGLYFAEEPTVAQAYRDRLGGATYRVNGVEYDSQNPAHLAAMRVYDQGKEEALFRLRENSKRLADIEKRGGYPQPDAKLYAQAADIIEKGTVPKLDVDTHGRLYEVRINASPEDFLDWDKPLSAQSEKVKAAIEPLARAIVEKGHPEDNTRYLVKSGSGVQHALTKWGADRLASKAEPFKTVDDLIYRHGREKLTEALQNEGVKGIKYFDQQSRGTGEGTRNYVVFRDDIISILKKYGLAGLLAGGAAATKGQEAKASP